MTGFSRTPRPHEKRWRGTHIGRARRHRCRFRAPARADRSSAFPCGRHHLDRWDSRAQLHFHSNWQRSAFPCLHATLSGRRLGVCAAESRATGRICVGSRFVMGVMICV